MRIVRYFYAYRNLFPGNFSYLFHEIEASSYFYYQASPLLPVLKLNLPFLQIYNFTWYSEN